MQGLILGIDLCDDYCQAGYYDTQSGTADSIEFDEDNGYMIPMAVCKIKDRDEWKMGGAAYRSALCDNAVTVDKLVSMCNKNGTITIDKIKYDSRKLMTVFLRNVISMAEDRMENRKIERIVFTARDEDTKVFETVKAILPELGIAGEKINFATHSEAYMYYIISQKPDVFTNMACLFDLSDNHMDYYEFAVTRGRKPQIAEVIHQKLEEGFSLDILDTAQGRKIADKILCSCSERLLGKRVVTSVFLTGRAFDSDTWAENFIKVFCCKRRVFLGQGLFAQGAAYLANEYNCEEKIYPYTCICNGRILNNVVIEADYLGQPMHVIAAQAGSSFRSIQMDEDFILDNSDKIEFVISGVKMPWHKKIAVALEEFPKRKNRTTRINIKLWFESDNVMKTEITDLGFGEFYPSSGRKVCHEFRL